MRSALWAQAGERCAPGQAGRRSTGVTACDWQPSTARSCSAIAGCGRTPRRGRRGGALGRRPQARAVSHVSRALRRMIGLWNVPGGVAQEFSSRGLPPWSRSRSWDGGRHGGPNLANERASRGWPSGCATWRTGCRRRPPSWMLSLSATGRAAPAAMTGTVPATPGAPGRLERTTSQRRTTEVTADRNVAAALVGLGQSLAPRGGRCRRDTCQIGHIDQYRERVVAPLAR